MSVLIAIFIFFCSLVFATFGDDEFQQHRFASGIVSTLMSVYMLGMTIFIATGWFI